MDGIPTGDEIRPAGASLRAEPFPAFSGPAFAATQGAGHGAGAVSRISQADAWWRIPIGQGQFTSGDVIEIRPMDGAAD